MIKILKLIKNLHFRYNNHNHKEKQIFILIIQKLMIRVF